MSRSDARSTPLRRRPSRTVPATVVAVLMLAVGALTAVAAIAQLVNGSWPSQVTGVASTAAKVTWGSTTAITAGAGILVVGLILLIAGLKRGAFSIARLDTSVPSNTQTGGAVAERDYVISNRAMARIATAHADTVDGVDKVSASASGRRVHLSVNTTSEQTAEISQRVVAAVTNALVASSIQPQPRVTASVRTKEI